MSGNREEESQNKGALVNSHRLFLLASRNKDSCKVITDTVIMMQSSPVFNYSRIVFKKIDLWSLRIIKQT